MRECQVAALASPDQKHLLHRTLCHVHHGCHQVRQIRQHRKQVREERPNLRQTRSRRQLARRRGVRLQHALVRVVAHDLVQILRTECAEVVIPRVLDCGRCVGVVLVVFCQDYIVLDSVQ